MREAGGGSRIVAGRGELPPGARRPGSDEDATRAPRRIKASASGAVSEDALPEDPRYAGRGLLGRGGQGLVFRAFDRELDREVALKTVRPGSLSPELAEEFIEEARATARLSHPNIVPIFDVGRLADRRPFYTMKLLTGQSLAGVLEGLRDGGREDEWSLVRLVQVIQQVAQALQLAHDHGIVHRDVKPANVMLGPLGEVLLVDWGIAKRSGRRDDALSSREHGRRARMETEAGLFKGTPAFMSPEHVRGAALDGRADVYSLGVVLYQTLALRRPFEAATTDELLDHILNADPPPPETLAGERHVPRELSRLALHALAREPDQRVPSAAAFAAELQDFLEGVADRSKREAAALSLQAEARARLVDHREVEAAALRAEAELARLAAEHLPWHPVEGKRALFRAQDELEARREGRWVTFLDGANLLTDALAHVPDHPEIRRELAELFWPRFLEAEKAQHRLETVTYRKLVERFHDGRYSRELDGRGSLELQVEPSHAELTLHPLVEVERVLVDGPPRPLGRGSARIADLAMGSYVVVARADGHEPARYPVWIERCTEWRGSLRLLPAGALPPGFILVPGTETWLGGDDRAMNSWPLRRVRVETFAIAKHPVTFGEYCEFLADLTDEDAQRWLPRTGTEGALASRRADGSWEPFAGVEMTPHFVATYGLEAKARIPVVGIDRASAEAYAAWRAVLEGRKHRLPTGEEWELAARGVDRRRHPWGDRFDAALCHVSTSFEEEPDLAPVGTFRSDRSIYGACDMAGCIQEWTSGWIDQERALAEVRGASWAAPPALASLARRQAFSANGRLAAQGMRLVMDLQDEPQVAGGFDGPRTSGG